MYEPVAAADIMKAVIAGAMVVLAGAGYALFFALGKIAGGALKATAAYLSYGVLVASVLVLAQALNLNGFWRIVVGVMLVGYLLAPHAIWHLCVGTHEAQGRDVHG